MDLLLCIISSTNLETAHSHSHLYCTSYLHHILPAPHLYRAGFADKANQDVANTLVTEVKTHLPDVPSVTIKGKPPFRNGVIVPIL